MDQRAEYIRQDIESTRASLDAKLDSLESKARQTFDLKHQVSERPWMALGAAVAAGYVLGSLGSNEPEPSWHGQPATTTDYNQRSYTADHSSQPAHSPSKPSADRFLAPFDAEISMLKTAAITTLTNFLHDAIKEYVPALGQQLDTAAPNGNPRPAVPVTSRYYEERPSTAPNTQADRETLNDLLTGSPPADTHHERSIGADTRQY